MTKDTCAVVQVHGLTFLVLVAFSAGCATNQVKDFTPKSAMVCDPVRITGPFHYEMGDLAGVWFNGVPAFASFRHFPAPKGPLEILAIVPEGASNGPIRIKISTDEISTFGPKSMDYTFSEPFIVTGSPPVPAINSFSANPATIGSGQSSTLSWEVSPAVKQLTLDEADVSGTNSQTVSPTTTTVYYLVAKNESCLKQSRAVAVTVVPSLKVPAPGSPVNPPGDTNTVNGGGLAQTNEPPPAVPSPVATTTVPAATHPADQQLTAPKPAPSAAGPVTVPTTIVSNARNTNAPVLAARKNGPFVDIKSKIGLANQTCGSKQLEIVTNRPGEGQPDLAVFRQDGAILAQHHFQPGLIGGAAFSPGGDEGVSVTADPNGFSASCLDVVERFATHYKFQFPVNVMDGFKPATGRWHVLFSPDDTLVMVSSVPVGGPAKIAVQVHDLVRRKDIGPLIQADCAACDLQGEVINGNTVVVKLDGAVVATFPIQ